MRENKLFMLKSLTEGRKRTFGDVFIRNDFFVDTYKSGRFVKSFFYGCESDLEF